MQWTREAIGALASHDGLEGAPGSTMFTVLISPAALHAVMTAAGLPAIDAQTHIVPDGTNPVLYGLRGDADPLDVTTDPGYLQPGSPRLLGPKAAG